MKDITITYIVVYMNINIILNIERLESDVFKKSL